MKHSKCKTTVPPMFDAEVSPHSLSPRWLVPQCRIEVPAPSADFARREVVLEAHRRSEVPPWKPLVAISLEYASATPVDDEAQGKLFIAEQVAA
jgi:hypothetical protein